MKFKVIFMLVGAVLIFSYENVYATPGRLKNDSIVNCGGAYYGSHGDGHYHKAIRRDSGWYPDEESFYTSNPCAIKTTTTKKTTIKATTKKTTTSNKTTLVSSTTVKMTTTTTTSSTTVTTTTTMPVTTTIEEKETTTNKSNDENANSESDSNSGLISIWLASGLGIVGYKIYKAKQK